jgi:class 3 adenylate cyclase/tetratricopeptide (TPR) repeat protein
VTGIQEWLTQLGLEKYAPVFEAHEITVEVLPHLTEPDIDRLALPTGPRRRLMIAIDQLAEEIRARTLVEGAETSATRSAESEGAERRQLTILFCDLVGSTALSQRLDPEELRELMQAYRAVCGDAVARYQGYVAQYLGDGLMVYFGWPTAHEDDAERSVRAALEIVHAVREVKAQPPLAVRIGVATGTVVVGEDARAENAEAKLALGETPNLAARLQGLAGPNEIVIAPATRRLVGGQFELIDLGAHELKGIAQPVRAWRVQAVHRSQGRFEAAHEGVALTPLVGREEEVALLLRRWQQARDGEGQVALIGGEPGIGKSRLARVLQERIEDEPHTTLHYQCSPYHLNSPLYPILEQLEFAAGFVREDAPEQKLEKMEAMLVGSPEERAEAAPLIAGLLSLPVERYAPLALSPQKRKEKTLEALAGQLETLSRQRPVLIVFEDVHWIDPTSQEALDALVPRLQERAIMLVVTYRPEYMPHWADQPHVSVLGLARLARRQGAELATQVARGRPLPAAVLAQIVVQTDGVPLFVEELTKSVLESGLLPEAGDKARLQSPALAATIPTSLRDSLLARLDRFAPIKYILQIGACIGREFSYELLARVSALSGEQLEDALRKLTATGLVYRRGIPPSATYTFKHALVQDAAYDSLLKSKRQQLHARIAQVLEEHFADRVAVAPELLAHHYTQAGNPAMAIPRWREAGDLSARRVAFREAISHLDQGIQLIGSLPPSPERDDKELELRTLLGTAWVALGGFAASEAWSSFHRALELAKTLNRHDALLPVYFGLCSNLVLRGRLAEGLDWVNEMLASAEATGDGDLLIIGHRSACTTYFWLGDFNRSRGHGNRVLELYDEDRHRRLADLTNVDPRTVVEIYLSIGTWILGYPDRALQLRKAMDAHARRRQHPFDMGYALTFGSQVWDFCGEPEALLESVEESDRLGRAHSLPFISEVLAQILRGIAYLRAGRVGESIPQLRGALDKWTAGGGLLWVPYLRAVLAEGLALSGDLEGGLSLVEESLVQIFRPGWEERSHLAEVLRLKGWMLQERGECAVAQESYLASLEVAREQQAKSWELRTATSLARLWRSQGKRQEARELLASVHGWFTEGFATRDLVGAKALLDELS